MNTEIFYSELIALEESLTRFAHTFTSNPEDVKDLVQETFLKALLFKEQFVSGTNLGAWTFIIMRNIFINDYRKRCRQATMHDPTPNQVLLNNSSTHITPETLYLAKEVDKVIDSLGEELRITFRMYILGYKYRVIAEILDLKLGTVKSRIFLARKNLKETLRIYF